MLGATIPGSSGSGSVSCLMAIGFFTQTIIFKNNTVTVFDFFFTIHILHTIKYFPTMQNIIGDKVFRITSKQVV